MKKIYTITTIHIPTEKDPEKRTRTWGWYPTFKDADKAVRSNATDMFEAGWFNHAVIEEVEEGLMPLPSTEHWYKATYSKKRRQPLVRPWLKPEYFTKPNRIVGFSMG